MDCVSGKRARIVLRKLSDSEEDWRRVFPGAPRCYRPAERARMSAPQCLPCKRRVKRGGREHQRGRIRCGLMGSTGRGLPATAICPQPRTRERRGPKTAKTSLVDDRGRRAASANMRQAARREASFFNALNESCARAESCADGKPPASKLIPVQPNCKPVPDVSTPRRYGGQCRARTCDLLLVRQAL